MLCTATPEFQIKAKISTIRPVFPDYLSISYCYAGVKHDDWKQKVEEIKIRRLNQVESTHSQVKKIIENIELATCVPKYTASDECMFQLFLNEH